MNAYEVTYCVSGSLKPRHYCFIEHEESKGRFFVKYETPSLLDHDFGTLTEALTYVSFICLEMMMKQYITSFEVSLLE